MDPKAQTVIMKMMMKLIIKLVNSVAAKFKLIGIVFTRRIRPFIYFTVNYKTRGARIV
jgi:hypothetical protein